MTKIFNNNVTIKSIILALKKKIMSIEIERKFLVKNSSFKEKGVKCLHIKQGFLNSDKNRVVRIRIVGDKGFITIKGKSSKNGLSRFEWEKEINLQEAESLFDLCEVGVIQKKRYLINHKSSLYEVDVFLGENDGLIIAEVELKSETELFSKPQWLGEEVTGIAKYYNSELSRNPFKNWA